MWKNFDLHCAYNLSISAEVLTADEVGASVDMKDYDACTFLAVVGVSGDTLSGSVYIELEVQDSADDSSFAAVADAELTDSVTGTNTGTFSLINDPAEDDVVAKTTYIGSERYVLCNVNVTGTHSNGTPISVIAIRHAKHGDNPGV